MLHRALPLAATLTLSLAHAALAGGLGQPGGVPAPAVVVSAQNSLANDLGGLRARGAEKMSLALAASGGSGRVSGPAAPGGTLLRYSARGFSGGAADTLGLGVLEAERRIAPRLAFGGWLGGGDIAVAGLHIGTPSGTETGTVWRLSAGYAESKVALWRYNTAGTLLGRGSETRSMVSAEAMVGQKFVAGPALLTPFVLLRREVQDFDGYTETSGSAPVLTLARGSQMATVAALGVDVTAPLGQRGRIGLTAGVETDLDRSGGAVSGSSGPGIFLNGSAPRVRNDTRPFAALHGSLALGQKHMLEADLAVRSALYSSSETVTAGLAWVVRF